MLNLHLSYKNPISWRILFCSRGYTRKFSRMKKFRALMVPGGGCHKGIIIQGIMTTTGVLPNGKSCLIRRGDLIGAYFHEIIQRNSMYVYMLIWSIYDTIWLGNPDLQICRYQRRPPGTCFTALLHQGADADTKG